MSETFTSIPFIDFGQLQDPATKPQALEKLRDAIFVVGFLYLTNHGLEVWDLSVYPTKPPKTTTWKQDSSNFK